MKSGIEFKKTTDKSLVPAHKHCEQKVFKVDEDKSQSLLEMLGYKKPDQGVIS
jgi:hypothetical protein